MGVMVKFSATRFANHESRHHGFAGKGGQIGREMNNQLKEDIELCNFKINILNTKIDGVAVDLKAHRSDTEAHHGVYRVKEN